MAPLPFEWLTPGGTLVNKRSTNSYPSPHTAAATMHDPTRSSPFSVLKPVNDVLEGVKKGLHRTKMANAVYTMNNNSRNSRIIPRTPEFGVGSGPPQPDDQGNPLDMSGETPAAQTILVMLIVGVPIFFLTIMWISYYKGSTNAQRRFKRLANRLRPGAYYAHTKKDAFSHDSVAEKGFTEPSSEGTEPAVSESNGNDKPMPRYPPPTHRRSYSPSISPQDRLDDASLFPLSAGGSTLAHSDHATDTDNARV